MTRLAYPYVLVIAIAIAIEPPASAQQTEASPQTVPIDSSKNPRWISGAFDASTDLYWSDHDNDFNLDQTLRLDIDPPKFERLHLRGSLWIHEDLDSDEDPASVLSGIDDAYDSDVRANLLEIYLDVDDLWGDSVLRLGRQRIYEGFAFNRIDGASFRQRRQAFEWYAFAGLRASLYENAHSDPVLGSGIAYRPAQSTRLALDVYYAEERRGRDEVAYRAPLRDFLRVPFPREVRQNIHDTAAAVSVWHDLGPNVRLHGRYLWKDGNGDELFLNVIGYVPAWDLDYEIAARAQLTAAGDQVNDLTNFYRILGRYEPYYNVFGAVHRPLTDKILVSLEAEIHDAQNDDPLSANRDYQRYALLFDVDQLVLDLDATVSFEYWSVDSGEGSFAITGELTRQWKGLRATLGADFERYEDRYVRYNQLPLILSNLRIALNPNVFRGFQPLVGFFDTTVVETSENVYSIYTKVDWALSNNQDLNFRVTYEQDDGPDSPYWRVQAAYSIRF